MSFDLQSLPFICSNLQNEPEERSHASKPVSVFKERVKKCNWQSNDSLYFCVFSPGLIPALLFLFVRGGESNSFPPKVKWEESNSTDVVCWSPKLLSPSSFPLPLHDPLESFTHLHFVFLFHTGHLSGFYMLIN